MLATVEFVALILVLETVNKLMPSDARPHTILASVFSLLGIINTVVLCRAARKDVRCCHCNSPIPLDSLKWHFIASGLLPVCKQCRANAGAEFINPLPANPASNESVVYA
jgi:hypothetical protein